MNEQPIASARASVMVYDAGTKKWIPSGSSSGLSKVHIYHNVNNNTFRVVGRKVQDHEVVINCSILKGLKYFQAAPTFHQWRDNSQIHGLNFASRDDAETFALAMERVLGILDHSNTGNYRSPSQSHPMYQTIGHSGVSLDDYAEYRGWMNNENSERKSSSEYGHSLNISNHVNHSSHPNTPGTTPSPNAYSHHRASSVPSMPQQQLTIVQQSQQPSPQSNIPPPPPPPPPTNSTLSGIVTLPRLNTKANTTTQSSDPEDVSLATALASAKLRKTPQKEPTISETKHTPPIMKGMASMMDEMTRTLARRRAQTDNVMDNDSTGSNDSNRMWTRQNSANGYSPNKNSGNDSPQSLRRSESDGDTKSQLIEVCEIEKIKQDILVELKKEVNKMKLEIIDAIKMELNRR